MLSGRFFSKMNAATPSYKYKILLYLSLLCYSLSSVLSKCASNCSFFSWKFILLYGGSLSILVVYAIVWQQVLKYMPLSMAYANKPIASLLSMLWGIIFFGEALTIPMVIGAILIMVGIHTVVKDDD